MPNEPLQDEFRNLWQDQPSENITMSLEEIRAKAGKFQRRIWRRNALEYGAIAIVVIVFGLYLQWFPAPVMRAGSVMIIAGALYVAYQLHRRAASETTPAAAEFEQCLGFHRRALERQREALANIWSWYLGPFIPGLTIFSAGMAMAAPIPFRHRVLAAAIMLAVIGGVFWLVAQMNLRAARKLQIRIDELKSLEQ